jgi:hypothetical protein
MLWIFILSMTDEDGKARMVIVTFETGLVTMDQDCRKTLSVPEAGKQYFDLGKNASYEAARRGDLPIIKIGSRLRVPIAALERMLAEAGTGKAT